ncbi:MAG: glycosyltransferase family 4 protein [Cyclobacteriaceae bacterium]|nr:glycosyltransferase family 4 protein [Cyclobacteriaceae bacterium]
MRILITIDSFYDGGAEMAAIRLANALQQQGEKIVFLELNSQLSSEKKQIRILCKDIHLYQPDYNTIVAFFYKMRFLVPVFFKPEFTRLYHFIKKLSIKLMLWKENIWIINSHHISTDDFFSKMNSSKYLLVSSFHGHYELLQKENSDGDKVKGTFSRIFEGVDHIVYTADKHKQTLESFSYPLHRTSRIYYGIDFNYTIIPTTYYVGNTLSICVVSRAIAGKGWEELVQATLNLSAKNNYRLKLHLIGDGPLLDYLKDKYSKIPNIEFCGYKTTEEIFEHLNYHTHITALLSTFEAESMPNSIIEYLACGKPVIATDNGAIPEMLEYNGELAGTIIKLTDRKLNIEDVEDAIKCYLNDPKLVEIQSVHAFKAFEKFRIEKSVGQYQQLFKELSNQMS